MGAEDIGLRLKGVGRAKEIDIVSSMEFDRDILEGIPVLTGWFGEGDDGDIALLTRGGSDHSAAAFARLTDASKLVLWKDVDGIKRLIQDGESKLLPFLIWGMVKLLNYLCTVHL